ncbi:MAG: sulfatase [Deltaproteobacteria bacterium]|nr:sulfatase [Deltaproteobacteria bacterium]
MITLLLATLACGQKEETPAQVAASLVPEVVTPPAAPTEQPEVKLESGNGAIRWRALDHLAQASLSFPDAAASAEVGRFVLAGPWKDEGERRGGMRAYTTPLPFATNMPRPNYAPMGARLLVDGAEVPFNTTISAPTKAAVATWYVDHGSVVIVGKSNPNDLAKPAEVIVDELAAAVKQRQLAGSGLSPAEFAVTTFMVGRVSRPALYLPAPASASFTVEMPRKGVLKFGHGLLEDPISGKASGNGATLKIEVDGKEVWSGKVDPATKHDGVEVKIDREAAGSATIRFSTDPAGDSAGDYVAVTTPTLVDAEAGPARRVLVVGIDTLRWDALGANGYARATSPELDQWLAQSVQFDRAYSPAPRTKPSFLTAFTGRWPREAKGAPRLAEILRAEGLATAGVVGNVHLVPRFGFARGMDHWEYENGARGEDEVARALAWLDKHDEEDALLFVHFMDPHTFYSAPLGWADKFQEGKERPKGIPAKFNRWQILDIMKERDLGDEGKAWIRNAYDAEVAYTTHQVSRLLAAVEKMPGQTLTVLHTDHGEEFWDHGGFEHNHSLFNELVQTELAIRPPGGWQGAPRVSQPVSLADIVPTVLDFLGVAAESRPATDGMSLRPFVDKSRAGERAALETALVERPLPLGHMRYERDRWGVVYKDKKYILHTASGREEFFDLAADPGEQNDLFRMGDKSQVGNYRELLATATGVPVRPGWRMRIPTTVATTTVSFTAPIADAGILDPEWNAKVRANLEWGERPAVLASEVGKVSLSADRKTVTFEPGERAQANAWWIQCEAVPCPDGTLRMSGHEASMSNPGRLAGETRYAIEKGWLLIPSENIDASEQEAAVSEGDVEALESLGYLQGAGDEH